MSLYPQTKDQEMKYIFPVYKWERRETCTFISIEPTGHEHPRHVSQSPVLAIMSAG